MKRGILWAGSAAVLMAVAGGIGMIVGAKPEDVLTSVIVVFMLVTLFGGIALMMWDM